MCLGWEILGLNIESECAMPPLSSCTRELAPQFQWWEQHSCRNCVAPSVKLRVMRWGETSYFYRTMVKKWLELSTSFIFAAPSNGFSNSWKRWCMGSVGSRLIRRVHSKMQNINHILVLLGTRFGRERCNHWAVYRSESVRILWKAMLEWWKKGQLATHAM